MPNRLATQSSPYLLQHANNPVDWYPWGSEALDRAKRENKPILLSIGYAACHWCHVMEHESFEDPAIASLLNEHFVSVKVDREERPDVDRVYMAFVQGTTGSGGWPMSVWLTPDLKPFYGGTYFPPTSRWNRPGFIDVLRELHRAWTDKRSEIERSARSVTEQLKNASQADLATDVPSPDLLTGIAAQFASAFDQRYAGFGSSPKFPRPSELLFLLREHVRSGDADAKAMVLSTLRAMALGGMRDHIGGGFHRYSVDTAWRVPHFEKMLYDQGQLVLAYLEAAQVSGDAFFLEVAEDTLRYVMREMTGQGGGFYSAEDADSIPPEQAGKPDAHKMEGAFYLWRARELDDLLGDASALVKRRFGIEADGNAPVDPQQEFVGKNLLYVAHAVQDVAEEFGRASDSVSQALSGARLLMFQARLQRPRPHLDDKILTAWNGLMIAAFARAARVVRALAHDGRQMGAPYLEAARRTARFIRSSLWNDETGRLLRRYRDGHAEIDGYAEDYAYLIFGLLELFQADPDPEWLEWAVTLQRTQDALFWDEDSGGWFSTTGQDPTVLLRMKEDYDGAEPAASSVAVGNLLRLVHLAPDATAAERIERTLARGG
ncbi:MAG TPA: thioredoxin domain-containing protein, partial [Gemmatimonadaceae bacterium]